jgi:hypothetical protein
MQDLGKVLCWLFAVTALLQFGSAIRDVNYAIQHHYIPPLYRSLVVAVSFSVLVAVISGIAWWTIWKSRPSARGWAIAASALSIMIYLRSFALSVRFQWHQHLGALIIGIVGLAVFLPRSD